MAMIQRVFLQYNKFNIFNVFFYTTLKIKTTLFMLNILINLCLNYYKVKQLYNIFNTINL